MTDDELRDPFRDEEGGPWHHSLRKGEMVFLALTELDSIVDAIIAVQKMDRSDLEAIVLERLYIWHALQARPRGSHPTRWLTPQPKPDS